MELSRLHDNSTVHWKLTQLKIITQIENFKLNEGESKKERVANPLQSKRKTLSSMRKLPKTLLPSGRPYAWCACDDFVDYDRANITADILCVVSWLLRSLSPFFRPTILASCTCPASTQAVISFLGKSWLTSPVIFTWRTTTRILGKRLWKRELLYVSEPFYILARGFLLIMIQGKW